MKRWPLIFVCLLGLAGCSSEYLVQTTDGQMLTSDGKPELDAETGMLELEDSEGREQRIPESQVKQVMPR
ncbi:YgdI/YgdR family lipoprotein [Metapseudomonas otitidis]|uniref:YgdI/YgdR family lipoprotein n=1 Tax=Metapseudomonas otitidis TaxID=319939 RepID=UPI0013F66398|nr:YgdI/YgdR family lipoprotein [Pseudomonas otitidis]